MQGWIKITDPNGTTSYHDLANLVNAETVKITTQGKQASHATLDALRLTFDTPRGRDRVDVTGEQRQQVERLLNAAVAETMARQQDRREAA